LNQFSLQKEQIKNIIKKSKEIKKGKLLEKENIRSKIKQMREDMNQKDSTKLFTILSNHYGTISNLGIKKDDKIHHQPSKCTKGITKQIHKMKT